MGVARSLIMIWILLHLASAADAQITPPPPVSHWALGRSFVDYVEAEDGSVTLTFKGSSFDARGPGMPDGVVLFSGKRQGALLSGELRSFKRGCEPVRYLARGLVRFFGGEGHLELHGTAPLWSSSSCATRKPPDMTPDTEIILTNPRLGDE
jgi:hypothetical protein